MNLLSARHAAAYNPALFPVMKAQFFCVSGFHCAATTARSSHRARPDSQAKVPSVCLSFSPIQNEAEVSTHWVNFGEEI